MRERYDLPHVVFRMSCIYGPHQFGTEDQGWVAHFLIRAAEGSPSQFMVMDGRSATSCYVEDLVNAMLVASRNSAALAGRAFNIGGGLENTVSLNELLDMIEDLEDCRPEIKFEDWRGRRPEILRVGCQCIFSRLPDGVRECRPAKESRNCTRWLTESFPACKALERGMA